MRLSIEMNASIYLQEYALVVADHATFMVSKSIGTAGLKVNNTSYLVGLVDF